MRSLSSTRGRHTLDLEAVAEGRVEDLDGYPLGVASVRWGDRVSWTGLSWEQQKGRPAGRPDEHVDDHVLYGMLMKGRADGRTSWVAIQPARDRSSNAGRPTPVGDNPVHDDVYGTWTSDAKFLGIPEKFGG